MNPLYNNFGNNMTDEMFNQLFQQATELKRTLKGNPQQLVQNLLNSGQMSQSQFNQLSQIANQVIQAMGNK